MSLPADSGLSTAEQEETETCELGWRIKGDLEQIMADPEDLHDNSHPAQLGAGAPAADYPAPYNHTPYIQPSSFDLSAFQPGASANSAYLRIPNAYHGPHGTATPAASPNLPWWLANGLETADRRTQHSIQHSNRLMPPYENSALDLPPSCSPIWCPPCIRTATRLRPAFRPR